MPFRELDIGMDDKILDLPTHGEHGHTCDNCMRAQGRGHRAKGAWKGRDNIKGFKGFVL